MTVKKKLGIIGGMGSRAGACFLQKIIDYSPATSDQEFLEIIYHNNAAIPDRTRAIVYNEPSPIDAILRSVDLFNRNGIEVITLGCITSYYYYRQITEHTSAYVINPLHLIFESIKEDYAGALRIGILATTGTINSGLFHQELGSNGLDIITLSHHDQENLFMRSVYMKNGFKSAHISQEARDLMKRSIDKLSEQQVDLIIGGCTEVSVAISPDVVDFPYIDTLDLLAKRTVDYCYNLEKINYLKEWIRK
ncbi:aspartate/glutamate racemase family protein [Pedobacter sp. KACC 23697]|uniref:Amino acid racemase n=1 Tax=Pedobacter sp. KACC 23697 TaxID=3149230 RepID=A0AAU7K8T3_9SPHI